MPNSGREIRPDTARRCAPAQSVRTNTLHHGYGPDQPAGLRFRSHDHDVHPRRHRRSSDGRQPLDVLIDGERIAALVDPALTPFGDPGETFDRVLDASGKYCDPRRYRRHTHMEMPFGGTVAADTFESRHPCRRHGGTTTIIDFAIQRQGERVQDTAGCLHSKAQGNCAIDYGFHQILGGVDTRCPQGDGRAGRPRA